MQNRDVSHVDIPVMVTKNICLKLLHDFLRNLSTTANDVHTALFRVSNLHALEVVVFSSCAVNCDTVYRVFTLVVKLECESDSVVLVILVAKSELEH